MADSEPSQRDVPSDQPTARSDDPPFVGMVRNLAEPIKLIGLNWSGFAGGSALPGQPLPVLTRGALTSDQPEFHLLANSTGELLVGSARNANIQLNLERYSSVLLVIHGDKNADLYLDTAAVGLTMLAKREVKAGQVVFQRDVADILALNFPAVTFLPDDKVHYIFRVDWKFGFFFDLGEKRALDVPAMERDLGHIYRVLRYQHIYDALIDEVAFERLIAKGWFPFLEVIGPSFKRLLQANSAEFDLTAEENLILEQFSDQRIDEMATRWFQKSIFAKRREIIQSGVDAFKRKDPVACVKILITEIEGIVRDAHIVAVGASAKIQELMNFAIAQGIKKVGSEATLFFPAQFSRYLRDFTFANFDPMHPKPATVSRHSVGHGSASVTDYTQIRGLQTLLTIDQLAFFL